MANPELHKILDKLYLLERKVDTAMMDLSGGLFDVAELGEAIHEKAEEVRVRVDPGLKKKLIKALGKFIQKAEQYGN